MAANVAIGVPVLSWLIGDAIHEIILLHVDLNEMRQW